MRSWWGSLVLLVALVLALGASLTFSVTVGAVDLPIGQVARVIFPWIGGAEPPVDPSTQTIVWELRLPRGLMAIIVGAGLALAGVTMQTLVRNPLADPYLLGISSGASVGATAVMTTSVLTGLGVYALSGGALLGALAATATVYAVTMLQGGITPIRLILSGVVLSAAFSALASLLVFKAADPRAARSVMFWMLGSVSGAQWNQIGLPLGAVLVCGVLLMVLSRRMDALASGPDTAATLGVQVGALRKALFFLQATLVGAMVAVAGGIGFVGLVIPHLARILVGALHVRLLPVAAAMGALFLLWVDVASRVIAPPEEIPLGVVTGLIGAPLFLFLLGRKTYRFGGEA